MLFTSREWEWICKLKDCLDSSGFEAVLETAICPDLDEADSAIAKLKILLESMELLFKLKCNHN